MPVEFLPEHAFGAPPAFPGPGRVLPAVAPTMAMSANFPIPEIDDGISLKLVLGVTMLCLVASLIFWFAVF